MLCPQFRPLVGGYERAAERLSLALAARGHHVEVVTERRDRAWPALERLDGAVVRRLPMLHRPGLHTVSSLLSFAAFLLLRGRSFDVIHVHQYGWLAALCVALRPLLRRPVVLKLTATGLDAIGHTLEASRASWLALALHRRVDACIATSERGVGDALALGLPAARIHRIPNGLDTARYKPLAAEERARLRAQLGVGGGPVVLYVGRLSPEKNPRLLLDAFVRAARGEGALLVFGGDGPQLRELEACARASPLAGQVRVLGRLEDPLPWYQAADLFVLPSHWEGLSNSLLEGLACGLPVVSTRVSGSEDVFESRDVGELVPVGDPEAMAVALGRLLADPERRRMCGAAAREVALERFSLVRVAEQTEALYGALGAGSARRASSS